MKEFEETVQKGQHLRKLCRHLALIFMRSLLTARARVSVFTKQQKQKEIQNRTSSPWYHCSSRDFTRIGCRVTLVATDGLNCWVSFFVLPQNRAHSFSRCFVCRTVDGCYVEYPNCSTHTCLVVGINNTRTRNALNMSTSLEFTSTGADRSSGQRLRMNARSPWTFIANLHAVQRVGVLWGSGTAII